MIVYKAAPRGDLPEYEYVSWFYPELFSWDCAIFYAPYIPLIEPKVAEVSE